MVKAPRSHREASAGKKVRERKSERTLKIVELWEKYQQHKYKESFEGNSGLLREHLSSLLAKQVSKNPDAALLDQDPGSPSVLWLKRADSVCPEPVSAGLPSVGAITLQSPALLCSESSLREPSACEEPTLHNRQENVAGLDWPASNDSFLSESEAIRNTLAINKETCRSQNKEESGCAGTELQNSGG